MQKNRPEPIQFDLSADQEQALRTIAGERQVRLSGRVVRGTLRVDFVACNAPFIACNAPFVASSEQVDESER